MVQSHARSRFVPPLAALLLLCAAMPTPAAQAEDTAGEAATKGDAAAASDAAAPVDATQGDAPAQAGDAMAADQAAPDPVPRWSNDVAVHDVLFDLGMPRPSHWVEPTPLRVRQGRDLTLQGWTWDDDGKRTKQQSRAFVCTDCHNLEREDPDLRASDPHTRLDYVLERGLPFLMGTTMYGVVDRTSWFNDDYYDKYGELVRPANAALREAVQLCSIECSSGRPLDEWEIDAILAYFWTIAIPWSDLPADAPSLVDAERAAQGSDADKQAVITQALAGFLNKSPADFLPLVEDTKAGYGLTGDPERGEDIYAASCMSCHERGGPGHYRMGFNKGKYRELLSNQDKASKWSYYWAIRKGTKPWAIEGEYMPHFTAQRMSNQQIEDLRAWLEQEVAK